MSGIEMDFICFSPADGGIDSAEKFSVVFSAALTFSLVLSFWSSKKKEQIDGPHNPNSQKLASGKTK